MNRNLKRWLTGALVVLVLVPAISHAQSADAVRLQLLQQLVQALQTQLELLLEQRVDRLIVRPEPNEYPIEDAVFYDDDSFLDAIDAEIVARYRIDDMDIASPSPRHERYVDRLAELLPEEYHDNFAELVVFRSDRDDVDAFVETTIPYAGEWRYGVSEAVFDEGIDSAVNTELMVHEFAHLFSLDEVFTTDQPRRCHEFFAVAGCVGPNTLYGKFLAEFWDDERLDAAVEIRDARNQSRAINKFYRENSDEFVSSYAASSPAEDFAESFAHYVLYADDNFGDVAEAKVQFFGRFSSTYGMKQEILSDI